MSVLEVQGRGKIHVHVGWVYPFYVWVVCFTFTRNDGGKKIWKNCFPWYVVILMVQDNHSTTNEMILCLLISVDLPWSGEELQARAPWTERGASGTSVRHQGTGRWFLRADRDLQSLGSVHHHPTSGQGGGAHGRRGRRWTDGLGLEADGGQSAGYDHRGVLLRDRHPNCRLSAVVSRLVTDVAAGVLEDQGGPLYGWWRAGREVPSPPSFFLLQGFAD